MTGGTGWPGPEDVEAVCAPLAATIARRARRVGRAGARGRGGAPRRAGPFVVGIAGPVGVGKSTVARVLEMLLVTSPWSPTVAVVSTDGFLYPNAELARRGLLERKGFPESYDAERLAAFLADVVAGRDGVSAPVYSHEAYDVEDGAPLVLDRPDIVVLEGLHVLSRDHLPGHPSPRDAVDLALYLHAEEGDVARWHLERCLELHRQAGPGGRFALLTEEEMAALARWAWDAINRPNLEHHIAPTRESADVVLEKGADHRVHRVPRVPRVPPAATGPQSASRSTLTPATSSKVTRLTVAPSLPGSEGDPE